MKRIVSLWSRWPMLLQLAIAGGVLLSALWAGLLLDMRQRIERERAAADSQLHTVARVGAQALQGAVRSVDLLLLDMREHWGSAHGNFDGMVQRTRAAASLGFPFEIDVLDASGQLLFSTLQGPNPSPSPADREALASLQARPRDELLVGALTASGPDPRPVIRFTRPLPGAAGAPAGVITLSVRSGYFSQIYADMDLGEGGALTVLRPDGTVLMRTTGRAGGGAAPDTAARANAGLANGQLSSVAEHASSAGANPAVTRLRSSIDGVERMYAWQRLQGYPLLLVLGQPEELLYRAAVDERNQVLLSGAAMSVLLLAALYWLLAHNRSRGQAARQMAEQLQQLRHSESELAASRQALREASAHYVQMAETERQAMAREVHDEIGQRLSVLRMELAQLPRAVRQSPESVLEPRTERLKNQVDDMLYIVRDLAQRLRPSALEFGLTTAVQALVSEFSSATGIKFRLNNRLPPQLSLPEPLATGAFRILQEALTNAVRHADATRVDVRIEITDGQLALRVHDNGRGIPRPDAGPVKTFGLTGMRERAIALGGQCRISSNPHDGTTVKAFIPVGNFPAQAPLTSSQSDSQSKESSE